MRKTTLLLLLLSLVLIIPTVSAEMVVNQTTCVSLNNLGAAVQTYGQSFIFNASTGRTCISSIEVRFTNSSIAGTQWTAGTIFKARLHWNESGANGTVLFTTDVTSQLQQAASATADCSAGAMKNLTVNWCGLNLTGNYTFTLHAEAEGAGSQWWDFADTANPYANGKEFTSAFVPANDIVFRVYSAVPTATNFQITASDSITSLALTTFNASVKNNTGTYYFSTTNGTIVTNLSTSDTVNVTVNATSYFSNSSINYATSSAMQANLTQWTAIYVKYIVGSVSLSNFSLNYTNNTASYGPVTTTSGVVYVPQYAANWNYTLFDINHNGANYSRTNGTLNATTFLRNYTFYVFTTNSFNITFRDERNWSILYSENSSAENVIVEFIGDLQSYNYSANGTLYVDLLTPQDYVIRYSKPGYGRIRQYLVTLTNQSNTNLNLFLLQDSVSSDLTITVYDAALLTPIQDTVVYLLRYNVTLNSYFTVAMYPTDVAGNAYFDVEAQDELYKFMVDYPWGVTKFISDPLYIEVTELNLYINTLAPVGETFLNASNISTSITYSNGSGNPQFTLTYSDVRNSATNYCFYLKTWSRYTNTVVNSSCSTSSSGSITLGGMEPGNTYYGLFTADIGGVPSTIATAWKEIPDTDLAAGSFGVFLTWVGFMSFIFLVRFHGIMPIIGSVWLAMAKLLGIFNLEWGYIWAIVIGTIILAIFVEKYKR